MKARFRKKLGDAVVKVFKKEFDGDAMPGCLARGGSPHEW